MVKTGTITCITFFYPFVVAAVVKYRKRGHSTDGTELTGLDF